MTGRYNWILIGVFLFLIIILFLKIADQVSQPEVLVNFVSAVLTLGIVLVIYSLIRHRSRRQEN